MSRRPAALAAALALPTLLAPLVAPTAQAATVVAATTSAGPIPGHVARTIITGQPSDGVHTVIAPVDRSGRSLEGGSYAAGAARPHVQSSSVLSTWTVSYTGFSAAAQAAFQRAVAIWSHTVTSSVPIVVDAQLTDFGPTSDQLGDAGPNGYWGKPGVVAFPQALANAIGGVDHFPTTEDIDAEFAANSNLFYYGDDPAGIETAQCTVPPETTPSAGSCLDFESIVLHELGHGLGFGGSGDVAGTAGYYGIGDDQNTPLAFDHFTETADHTATIDYPNGSPALKAALTGKRLYWNGGHGGSADRGREPRLYAPRTWLSGSSYSHLDDESYPRGDADSLMTPYAEQGDVFRDPGEIMLGMFRDLGWVTPGLPGSRYTPIAPVRVLDTGKTSLVPNGATRDISVTGSHGVPSNATAVVVNLTSSTPTTDNVLRAYPLPRAGGAPVPSVSNLNTTRRDTRANLATVPVGSGGRIRLLTTGGATRLVADLAGYYAPTAASYFHPRSPARIMDTRAGTGPVPRTRVGAGKTVDLAVAGKNLVPSGATAVVITLTAVKPTTNTYVSAYPSDGSPGTSNLNLNHGAVVANQVVVKLSADGRVRFRNNAGAVDLLADLSGWFDGNTGGALFRPALSARVKDSRPGTLGRAAVSDVGISELAEASWGVPRTATTAIVNLTGVKPTAATYLQLYPSSPGVPPVSNLNLAAGQTAAASATVRLGNGRLRVRNSSGAVAFVVDLQGWYGPA